jgi:hypothetical protein
LGIGEVEMRALRGIASESAGDEILSRASIIAKQSKIQQLSKSRISQRLKSPNVHCAKF